MIDKRMLFDIHRLNDSGHSIRKIAVMLGICRKTVRKYLDHPDIPKISYQRVSKLDSFKEKIDDLLKEDPDLSGEIVRQQIQKSGYTGSNIHSVSDSERKAMDKLQQIDAFKYIEPKLFDTPVNLGRPMLNRKVDRPPYEVLRAEISELGYSAVGRKYGVSDNAVRKWLKGCKKQ